MLHNCTAPYAALKEALKCWETIQIAIRDVRQKWKRNMKKNIFPFSIGLLLDFGFYWTF